ncbi:stage II sporulation protein P [Paenibacillus sp. MBLB4367]|uniref:stage II sporulation protein P n=1 Tax=Paenibacillus sp. MBLB4367 TaxID=3384767 RepID=UPI003907EE25
MRKGKTGFEAIFRVYMFLFAGLLLFFLLFFPLVVFYQKKIDMKPNGLTGKAVSVSSSFFRDMISMEVPHFQRNGEGSSLSREKVFGFLTDVLLGVSPQNPISLFASVIPRFDDQKPILLVEASRNDTIYPIHHEQPSQPYEEEAIPEGTIPPQTVRPVEPEQGTQPESVPSGPAKSVFIYHSHNRESWLPELPNVKKPELAFDADKNITLLGERLSAKLEEQGVGAVHSKMDYQSLYGDTYKSAYSYDYSKKTVKEVMAVQSELDYFIDIHRDSNPRKHTTIQANGVDYARVFFIVGLENPQWKQNQEFAKKLQEKLEAEVPGISRGIFGKTRKDGDGKYNQDLSPNSCVIEIGGVENTIEESNHTVDLLAKIIKDLADETNNRLKS